MGANEKVIAKAQPKNQVIREGGGEVGDTTMPPPRFIFGGEERNSPHKPGLRSMGGGAYHSVPSERTCVGGWGRLEGSLKLHGSQGREL